MRMIDADKAVQELQDYYHGSYSEVQLAPYQVDRWLEKRPTAMRWIPTGEQMPEDNITVLAAVSSIDAGPFVTIAWRDNHEWKFHADDDIPDYAEVVAWMELPEYAPAQEEKKDMPKTLDAHWIINFPCGPDGEHNFMCSSCGKHSWTNTRYCPYCGAKMEKGWRSR